MSGMSGLGIGAGSMHEAGRKMQAQVNEAEARRGRPSGPQHEPPRKEGFFKRFLAKLKR
jgi:hypothetical protein